MTAARAGRRIALAIFSLAAATAATAAAPDESEEPFTPAEYAEAVRSTVAGCTVAATLGPSTTPLPLEVSNFLLDHPDLSAFIVNRRRIAPYRIEMLGPRRSFADDGDGTKGVVNLIEETDRRRLYYGEGVHRSALFPDIRASAVIVMELGEATGPDAQSRTVTTFHVWVRIKNRFVSGLVKTLRPFLQGVVVGKFSKAFSVADKVGVLLALDPRSVAEDVRAYPSLFVEDREALLQMVSRLKPLPVSAKR